MMAAGEASPDPALYELQYPNELRADGLSITYADSSGSMYLRPMVEHDYAATRVLRQTGLTQADIVEFAEGQMLRYGPTTDLLPLPALLNSSIDRPESVGDVTMSLERAALLLQAAQQQCNFIPASISRHLFAIDRESGAAELLAPYTAAPAGTTWQEGFAALQEDLMHTAGSDDRRHTIERCVSEVLARMDQGRRA